jgi:hypothetical protein
MALISAIAVFSVVMMSISSSNKNSEVQGELSKVHSKINGMMIFVYTYRQEK